MPLHGAWIARATRVTLLMGALALVEGHGADEAGTLTAQTEEPRAFGYRVGDVVSRKITLDAPDGLKLDEASLPQVGRHGQPFELRQVDWQRTREAGHQRYRLALEYQVFLSPPAVRTLELPPVVLRFEGQPRSQELRIDAWPVTVAPLVPVEVSPRRGLGEIQPDAAPPLIETSAARQRLLAYALAIGLMLAYLAHVYLGLPWLARRRRPFTAAWRALRRAPAGSAPEQRRVALRIVHEALNRSAGVALFEQGIAAYLAAQPRFECLREDLALFFELSRREFFGSAAEDTVTGPQGATRWLLAFCRRCRDAERGAA